MLRIIIADDHSIVRQGLRQLLQEEFAPVYIEEAIDATDLYEKIMANPFDLIISDLIMPGGGALAVLKKIKAFNKDIPVIIISTYDEEQYASRLLQQGAKEFISKSNLPVSLVESVYRILATRQE